ncbi:MAG: nitroreductase [Verrucomicrobiales bacterium]|jgi:nitroreductase
MSMSATEAITSRRSIRAFTEKPVPEGLLRAILTDAARAPSGTNIQPWQVVVLQGDAKNDLVDAVQAAFDSGNSSTDDAYYPAEFVEPYLARRRKIGWDMYGLVGIQKGEYDKMAAQARKNFQFFDAPVGMIFTLHESMSYGGWMDLGLYMSNVMTLAREHGLHTCPQAAWREFEDVIHQHLELPADQRMIVGMAMGYEDTDHVINELRTTRAPLDDYVDFRE